jgi:hypothetical protein
VTKPKLSAAGGTGGQVLSTDGTSLQWKTDANSGGTVTSVATGTGLTGGPITTAGTISVNTSVIQQRVTGTCPAGGAIATIAANGTVTCTSLPGASTSPWPGFIHTTSGLANTGGTLSVPAYVSVVIGTDGLPLIAFYDVTVADLKAFHCEDIACTSGVVATIDSAGDVGKFNSITLESTGLGAISYYDASNGNLKLARCSDIACSSATVTTVDSTNDVGQYSSITANTNGTLAIAYYDNTTDDLKVAICNNAACGSPTVRTVESAGDVGKHASIVNIGLNLYIAYFDQTNQRLRLAFCSGSCASSTLRTLDATAGAGLFTSIGVSQDNTPVVAYAQATNIADFSVGGTIRVAKCERDALNTCPSATVNTINTNLGGPGGSLQTGTSIAVGADGMPVVALSYQQLIRCGAVDCASRDRMSPSFNVPSPGETATPPALTIGIDGMPLVVYAAPAQLAVIHCSSRECSNGRRGR